MKKCPNCNTSFEDEDVYCPNCGKKLVSVGTDTKVVIEAGSGGINLTENTTTQKNSNNTISESKPTQKNSNNTISESKPTQKNSNNTISESKPTQKNSNNTISESKPTQNIDMNNKNQDGQTSDSSTLRIILYFFGLGLIVLPFIITGPEFGFFWYLIIGVVAYILYALHRSDKKGISELNVVLLLFIIIAFVMLIWGPLNADY